MQSKLGAWSGAPGSSRKIFILGCGRSGTHWLGEILQAHPDIRVTFEPRVAFYAAARMAVDPRRKQLRLPWLLRWYRLQHAVSAPRHYADKTHPNLWLAEDLAHAFPEALFLGIQREARATVASMLEHPAIRMWHSSWRKLPLPNRFLGISEEVATEYADLSEAARFALRWRSHRDRMTELAGTLGNRLLVLHYEDLMDNTAARLEDLASFIKLGSPLPIPEVRRESLEKWRRILSPAQLEEIDRIASR